jgi:hypothetical protein
MNAIQNDFFPQGIAMGSNFCNRINEREQIQNNIESIRQTLIISPRRYGKTSIVLYVLSGNKLPFAHIDLFADLNEIEIQNSILGAIGDLLYSIEKGAKKALTLVTHFFADFNVNFTFSGERMHVEFSKSKKSPAKIILDALKKLDNTLKLRKQKVILFFDEFQRINQIAESQAIEAAIRSIAQESKNIMFIFSGSNRNILSSMFDDRSKPLYKLCDKIILSRIEPHDYVPFIQSKFEKIWGQSTPKNIVEKILDLTERHPYYVNVLCHGVSSLQGPLTEKNVEEKWKKYALSEKTNVTSEIDRLSQNQSKMLIALAKYGNTNLPLGKEFLAITGFSLSSAAQALKALERMDYIESQENGQYVIIDPLIKYIYSVKLIMGK